MTRKLTNNEYASAVVPVDADGNIINNSAPVVTGTVTAKGTGFSIPITLTVTNGAYTIGDAVGGLITIPSAVSAAGKHGVIYDIILSGVVANPYNLFFFASDIATPAADNAVGTMVAADIAMCKGVIPITATDYLAPVSAFNVATVQQLLAYSCTATTLYAYLIAVAVTSPGTTTLTMTFKGEFVD